MYKYEINVKSKVKGREDMTWGGDSCKARGDEEADLEETGVRDARHAYKFEHRNMNTNKKHKYE